MGEELDTQTTLDELKQVVKTFCEEREWDPYHGPKDLAIGMSTEAAELLELFRFRSESECEAWLASEEGQCRAREELSDVLFFVLRFAQKNGLDLAEAFQDKMAKNAAKYPVEKSRGRNVKYTDL